MTSKNLLCRLMREDIKRRLWAIAISVITFLFALPVYIATSLEQAMNNIKDNPAIGARKMYLTNSAVSSMGLDNSALILLTVILAVVCGISGFYYLQSKKKVDFYHSIPVKRDSLFASTYIVGIAIYVIPYLVSLAIGFVIAGANGALQSDVWIEAWKAFGINLLCYWITYTVVIIAVLLTGQLIVSILACAVFFAYAPMVSILMTALGSMYFDTHYTYRFGTGSILFRCSPLGAYYKMFQEAQEGTLQVSNVLGYLVIAIALVILVIFLYRGRKSEAAGKAISYKGLEPYIKTAVSIPIGLFGGLIFTSLMDTDSFFWLVFGMVSGYLLCSCLMEIIYHFDFKAAFKRRIQLLIGAVLMFAIFSTYKWDLLQYDQYVPSKDKIESMSISIDGIDTNLDFIVINKDKGQTEVSYMGEDEYAFQYMHLEDKNLAYEIMKRADKDGTINEEDEDIYESDDKYIGLKVLYRLKSGREVYRRYNYDISVESNFDLLNQLYQTKEYKEGAFSLYTWKEVAEVTCYNEFQNVDMTLTVEERAQLLSIYLDELTKLSLEDVREEVPVATIRFSDVGDRTGGYPMYISYVYPSFTNTIAFLTEHGFDFNKTYDLDNIVELNIDYSIPYEVQGEERYQEYAKEHPDWYYDMQVTYNDKDKISKIIPYIANWEYMINNEVLTNYDDRLRISVVTKTDEYGNMEKAQYTIDVNNIPDFVKEDIMYAEPK
ncbi:DUF6449 domain-containing protein [Anaerosporobacter sp.]